MCDRGVEVDHSTLSRWVQKYAPELDKRCRPHLKRMGKRAILVTEEKSFLEKEIARECGSVESALADCGGLKAEPSALHGSKTQCSRPLESRSSPVSSL